MAVTASPDVPYDVPLGEWSGRCEFRLMPTDAFVGGTSTLAVTVAASGRAVLLTYTWTHPDDGPQAGTLMLGVPDASGGVSAAWVDSWHQPDVVPLTGTGRAASAAVGYEYAPGWRWEIEVVVGDGTVSVVMHNLVPERETSPAVRYDVMRASWS
jgi:hypothetical protein